MPVHATGFCALWAKECAESEARTDTDTVRDTLLTFTLAGGISTSTPLGSSIGVAYATGGRGGSRTVTPTTLPAASPGGVIRWQGYLVAAGGTRYSAWCLANSTEWTIEGLRLANTVQAILYPQRFPPDQPVLQVSGAALAAIIGGLASADGEWTIAYPQRSPYHGRCHFTEFCDFPPDTEADREVAVRRIRNQFTRAGTQFSLGVTSSGVQRVVRDCAFAGLDAAGIMFLRPEDFGNQIEQIPAAVTDNTAQHFRFFPNAFFRRPSYVNSIRSPWADPLAIDAPTAGQPYVLRTLTDVPTASVWLFVIDGQPHVVRVNHPTGSDFRRPDEVWNGVIVPLIQNAQGQATFQVLESPYSFDALGSATITIDRMRYLQYARMLASADGGNFNWTDVTQTGTAVA